MESDAVWERVRCFFVESHGGVWRDDSHRRMMGVSTREWAEYLSDELGVRLRAPDVERLVIADMRAEYGSHLPLMPGAVEAVLGLASLWRFAVASGSPKSLIDAVLTGAGIADKFDVVVSSDEVSAPDVYLEAARRLGLPIDACVVVEDSTNGIRSAAAAGARVIAIPNSLFPPEAESTSLADLILGRIGQLTPEAVSTMTLSQN